MEHNGQEEIDKVLSFFTLRVLIKLTLAMALHPRLNKNSILRLLDENLIRKIACIPMVTFSEHAYWRLCQEIMLTYDGLELTYQVKDSIFSIIFDNDPLSYIELEPGPYAIDPDEDFDDDDDDDDLDAVMMSMNHKLLDDFMLFPEVLQTCFFGREMMGIQLIDPRDANNIVKRIRFCLRIADRPSQFTSHYYLLKNEVHKIMNVVDIVVSIATSATAATSSTPAITSAPPAATTADFTVRCPRCAAPMGEGGMPDALCTACWRLQNP